MHYTNMQPVLHGQVLILLHVDPGFIMCNYLSMSETLNTHQGNVHTCTHLCIFSVFLIHYMQNSRSMKGTSI